MKYTVSQNGCTNNVRVSVVLKTLLILMMTQCVLGCTVTSNGETRTYSVSDILNTVDQTLSGNRPEDSANDVEADEQPLLKNKTVGLLPQAKRLSWDRLLFAQMQLQRNFDFEEQADSYMRIYRPAAWKQYRNDEFELAAKRTETISMMQQSAESFNSNDVFLIQTSFKFDSYDFKQQIFPLDSISETSLYSYKKPYPYSLPGEYKLGFTNPSLIGDLHIAEEDAKAFVQKRKDRTGSVDRKVYAKLFFSNLKLDGLDNAFTANLTEVYIYSDSDYRLLLAKF